MRVVEYLGIVALVILAALFVMGGFEKAINATVGNTAEKIQSARER